MSRHKQAPQDEKPRPPEKEVKDPLAKYVDWRMLDDKDYGGDETLFFLQIKSDVEAFGLEAYDHLASCWAHSPEPDQLIVFSDEQGNVSFARFHEWVWDEILATDPCGNLVYIRPVTVLTILGVGRGGVFVPLRGQTDDKGVDL